MILFEERIQAELQRQRRTKHLQNIDSDDRLSPQTQATGRERARASERANRVRKGGGVEGAGGERRARSGWGGWRALRGLRVARRTDARRGTKGMPTEARRTG